MARPPSSTLSPAQRRVLDAVLKRERLQLPNFVSDLVAELALKAESSLGPTLQRMARLGVILLQGGGIQGRQRLVVPTPKGRLLCGISAHAGGGGQGAAYGDAYGDAQDDQEWLSSGAPAYAPTYAPAYATTHAPRALHRLHRLPLLGTIPAGPLKEVLEQQEAAFESVSVEDLLRHRPGDFLLRITGDSMVGDGIFEGDLVLLRPGIEVQQGEIAAVIWSGAGLDGSGWDGSGADAVSDGGSDGSGSECQATLKRVFRRPARQHLPEAARPGFHSEPDFETDFENTGQEASEGEILLRASNPAYADLVLPAGSVRIAGVFRGLIRPGTVRPGTKTTPTNNTKATPAKPPSGGAQ